MRRSNDTSLTVADDGGTLYNLKGRPLGPKTKRKLATFVAQGLSLHQVGQQMGMDEELVQHCYDQLVRAGFPVKTALSRQVGRVIYRQLSEYEKALESGKIAPTTLPVGIAVLMDKRAQLLGEPTSRIEHVKRELTHKDLNRYLESLPSGNVEPEPQKSDVAK